MAMPIKAEPGSTIAVVGASARGAAFSLLRAGYRVVAADLFADADLSRHCPVNRIDSYPNGFANWLQKTQCEGWLYTGALENHPELVDELAVLRPLHGNHGENLRRVRDPLLLQDLLQQAGFSFPETFASTEILPTDRRWLGKSYHGSSGSGVGAIAGALYRQRLVQGTPLSAVFSGNNLLGVSRQLVGESWTGAADFQYCGSIGPWPLPNKLEKEFVRLGVLLSEEFNLSGWYGVDLIQDGDQLWVIEVNPRYTASVEIVEHSHQEPNTVFGKAILFAKQKLVIDAELSESLLNQAGEIDWPRLADIPVGGTEIDRGQPVLTTFGAATSMDQTLAALKQRVACLEQQLYR